MNEKPTVVAEATAVRVALWRAWHVQVDAPPHVLHDEVGPPEEILALARAAGFRDAEHVSSAVFNERYFAGRTDDLRTAPGEELLVART